MSLWRALGLAVADDLQRTVADGPATPDRPSAALPKAVALHDGGDAFGAALAETLQAFGLAIDAAATPAVLVGGDAAVVRARAGPGRRGGLVAIGDAAARLLRDAGLRVAATAPQHGRLVNCVPVPGAPGGAARPFVAMRYATLALDDPLTDGTGRGAVSASAWTPWLRDEAGQPLVLARGADRTVCFLIRPESLLSDPLARDLLRAALAFAAG